ncbi:MAG: NAD(P)H-binding protein, partial [Microbacterium sp.]
ADHGVPADSSFFPYAEAKWAADAHLAASDLDWTILAPGTLTLDPPTGRIQLDPEGRGEVARADVAAVIAAVIADDTTIGRTLRFGAGDEHIGHAVAG